MPHCQSIKAKHRRNTFVGASGIVTEKVWAKWKRGEEDDLFPTGGRKWGIKISNKKYIDRCSVVT
jgi:hypothetical protein